MSETKKCTACNGTGEREYLVSQHDDKKETDTCNSCNGNGKITYMSNDDEQDYHDNYW